MNLGSLKIILFGRICMVDRSDAPCDGSTRAWPNAGRNVVNYNRGFGFFQLIHMLLDFAFERFYDLRNSFFKENPSKRFYSQS